MIKEKYKSRQTPEKYYVDTDTDNESFIKMAILLQEKGIENWHFFLKLYNKHLSGVNPYSKKLSSETKQAIFIEASQNRYYFIRELFRVGESGGSTDIGGGISFELNRGNLAMLWAADLNISIYQIMPRQFGKTWGAIADITWDYQFNKNIDILHFNKNQSDANENLQRIKTTIGMLPEWMQHSSEEYVEAKERRNTKNNDKYMKNTLNSSIRAMSSAGNESRADAMARGKTASKIWYDEIAFIFFNKAIFEAATPAYEKASRKAMDNGAPYSIIITTTPGDLACPHGEYAYQFMESCIKFNEEMYDLSAKKLFDIIENTPGKKQFLFVQFSHLELGETDEWYADVSKRLGDPTKAKREYLLQWINSNSLSPFDEEHLETIINMSKELEGTADILTINKYFKLHVYSSYKGPKPVIISVDVSGGLGRDSSAIVVINPDNLRPMAVFRNNMVATTHLEKILVTIVTKYYPHSIVTVENNSIGKPLLDNLMESPIRRNLYKQRVKRKIETSNSAFTKTKNVDMVIYGHNTNPDSRAKMMNTLESLVAYNKPCVAIPEIVEELKFLEMRNGRIQHSSSTHDDIIMAYMGGLYIIRYGTGLKGKGIQYSLNDEFSEYDQFIDHEGREELLQSIDRTYLRGEKSDAQRLADFLNSKPATESSLTIREKDEADLLKLKMSLEGIDADDFGENSLNILSKDVRKLLLKNSYHDDGYESLFEREEDDTGPVFSSNSFSLWGDD